MAEKGPILVITDHYAGVPTDAVWVALDGLAGVSLFFVEWSNRLPILQAQGSPDWFLLRGRFHHWEPASQMVRIPSGVPVYFIAGESDRFSLSGGTPGAREFAARNPSATIVGRYANPRTDADLAPGAVVIVRLR